MKKAENNQNNTNTPLFPSTTIYKRQLPRLGLHRRHAHTHAPIPGIMPVKSLQQDGPDAFAL